MKDKKYIVVHIANKHISFYTAFSVERIDSEGTHINFENSKLVCKLKLDTNGNFDIYAICKTQILLIKEYIIKGDCLTHTFQKDDVISKKKAKKTKYCYADNPNDRNDTTFCTRKGGCSCYTVKEVLNCTKSWDMVNPVK